jgi:SAM-dependent methyltransferase
MDLTYEAKYHQLEEQHWWFASRRDAVYDLIRSLKLPIEDAILEIGCSGGPLIQRLCKQGYTDVTGIDVSTSAIELAKACGVPHVSVMDGDALEIEDTRFNLVIASHVLEHIEEEGKALREWARVLGPIRRLIIFVQAHFYLWSEHNMVNHHFRRCSRTGLVEAMSRTGLRPGRSSLWNAALYLPTTALCIAKHLLAGGPATMVDGSTGDLHQFADPVNKLLLGWVRAENFVLRHADLPMGVSVFALAEKPI